jgi:hypothetical protein
MRRFTIASAALAGLALAAGPVFGHGPSPQSPPLEAASRGTVEKTFQGMVTELTSGRSLTISMDGGKSQTFRLDEKDVASNVDPGIAVGSRVRVVDSRDVNGKRTVTVRLATSTAEAR